MKASRIFNAVEVHAEGEQGVCYLGSVFEIPGQSMAEKLRYINEVDDSLRRYLTGEPRGRAQASTNLVFPSNHPEADAGFIILQSDRAHAMSGSNTICVVTALLETGVVAMSEPETSVTLETAAGLIRVKASCSDGKVERVTMAGVPSFVERLDVELDVEGIGSVSVDVAYGGCYYVLVDCKQLGVSLDRASAKRVVEVAQNVYAAASKQIDVRHPVHSDINFISYVMVTGDDDPASGQLRGATVLSGRVDRSPCGTGNSARLACLHARGLAHVGSTFSARSLIDSEFQVGITGLASVADKQAIVPQISGRGWIFGTRTTALDPTDPYPLGFAVADMWGAETNL